MKKSICFFCLFLTFIFYTGCKSVPEEAAAGKEEVLPQVSEESVETEVSGDVLPEDEFLNAEKSFADDVMTASANELEETELEETVLSEDNTAEENIAEDAESMLFEEADPVPEVEFEILSLEEETDENGAETEASVVDETAIAAVAEEDYSSGEIVVLDEPFTAEKNTDTEEADVVPVSQPVSDEKTVISEVSTVASVEKSGDGIEQPLKEAEPVSSEDKITEIEKNYDKNCFRDFFMDMNQTLYVSYPGSGWLFLGDETGSDSIVFQKRDFSDTQTTFQLKSVKSGKSLLHFYKKDIISNAEIHDFLKVSVSKHPASSVSVSAPAFKLTQFPEPAESESFYSEESYSDEEESWYSSIEDEPDVVSFYSSIDDDEDEAETSGVIIPANEDVLFETFFEQALNAFEKEDFDQINDLISEDNSFAGFEEDKYLYIIGRFYEAKTEYRNINKAYEAYKKLVELYKESEYWPFAEKRLTYLNRFYYSIR